MEQVFRRPFLILISVSILVVLGVLFILMFLIFGVSYGDKSTNIQTTAQAVYATNAAVQVAIDATVAAKNSGSTSNPAEGGDAKQVQQKRLVIKNANLQITVEDVQASLTSIGSMASEMTGWIVASKSFKTTYNGVDAVQATIAIRVPAERFDEALAKIKSGAKSVDKEDISGDDVTKQYTDLVSQQTNLEAAEAKLREIMDAAKDTKDVLDVYDELVKVRGQIEQIKGQIKFYEESAAFSSISVTLMPPEAPKPIASTGWRPLDTLRDAFESLLQFGQGLVNLLIWLVVFVLPIIIVIGIPTWFGWRISRRFNLPRRPTPRTPPPTEDTDSPDPEQFGSS